MNELRNDVIGLRRNLEKSIAELGGLKTSSTKYKIGYIQYAGKHIAKLLDKCNSDQRYVIIETLLDSKHTDDTEAVLIEAINHLRLEEYSELEELFKGIEHLLTSNIKEKVVILKLSDRTLITFQKFVWILKLYLACDVLFGATYGITLITKIEDIKIYRPVLGVMCSIVLILTLLVLLTTLLSYINYRVAIKSRRKDI